jgi:hypothetical protein
VIKTFSITIILKNRNNGFEWMYTTIYGSTRISLKNNFWLELQPIRNQYDLAWLIGGDFNVVRFRTERKGLFFNHSISRKFNSFISHNQLIDLKPTDRSYTWTNKRIRPSFALLNRFLCSITWENKFPDSTSKSLPRYQFDHNIFNIKI